MATKYVDIHLGAKADVSGVNKMNASLAELKAKTAEVNAESKKFGEAGAASALKFNDAISIANGNFGSLVKVVGKVIPAVNKLGAEGAMAIGALGAAIVSVIKLGKALYDLLSTVNNWDALPKSIREATSNIYDLQQGAKQFHAEMEESRKLAAELTRNFTEEVNAVNKLTKAQLEYNKAQELSIAKSKEERDAISAKYSLMAKSADEAKDEAIFDRRGSDLDAEEERIRAEIAQAEKTQRAARANSDRLSKAFHEAAGDTRGAWAFTKAVFAGGESAANRRANSLWNGAVSADNLAWEQEDIIDKKKKELEEVERKRKLLAQEREAYELNAEADVMNTATEMRVKTEEEQSKAAEDRIKKEIADTKKAIAEIAAEKKRLEAEAQKFAIDNIKERIATEKSAADTLRATSSRASTEFDQAFAMFRDPNKARAAIAEEQGYRDDLDRLHTSAARYGGKWRIDELAGLMAAGDSQGVSDTLAGWRKSKSFTPEIEAMVRASAAEKTKTSAEEELRKISANTEGLAEKLDELLTMKG